MVKPMKALITLSHPAEHVGLLTLNQPQSRNSLSEAMLGALQTALHSAAKSNDIHVLIIDAAPPVFCAGHDLKEMQRISQDSEATLALFTLCSQVMQDIVNLPIPVVAQIGGMATAAGCQLVAACDLAVAGASARFATPGVNIGLFCSTPMVALSRAMGSKQAMAMLLTGEPIDAAQALAFGLVNQVVNDEQLAQSTLNLAQTIAAKAPRTVALGKAAFYHQLNLPLAQAYAYTSQVMSHNIAKPDAQEGMAAFIDKRTAQWLPKTDN